MPTLSPDRSGYFTIPVSPDFLLEISKGTMPGYKAVRLIGNNRNVGTTLATVWDLQDVAWTPLPSATELFISSTSASDTTQTIEVDALDANYNEITLSATLNGQNQVSVGTALRVNNMRNISSTELQGTVYLAESDTLTAGKPNTNSKVQDIMAFDATVSRSFALSTSAIYTVPAGKTLFMFIARMYVSNLGAANDLAFWIIRETAVNQGPGVIFCGNLGSGSEDLPLSGFRRFEEKTSFHFAASDGASGTGAAISIDALLIDNDQF